jgi:hypothetical protein
MTLTAAEITARYRINHPERVRASKLAYEAAHPEKVRQWQKNGYYNHPENRLVNAARRRAKQRGVPFDLKPSDILPLPQICPVLGVKLVYGPSGHGRSMYKNAAAPSLDRIVNERGYVRGNVIVVSLRANLLKGQATIKELRKIADFYSALSGGVS